MRVVNDLGEAIDGLLETSVVAVDENEDLVSGSPFHPCVEFGLRAGEIHAVSPQRDEVVRGIARRPRRPLDLAELAGMVRRDRDDDVGEVETLPARSAKHDAGRIDDGSAGRGHEEVDRAGARRARSDNEIAVRTTGAPGDERRQADHDDRGGARPPRRRRIADDALTGRPEPAHADAPTIPSQSGIRAAPSERIRSTFAACPSWPARRARGRASTTRSLRG